MEKNDPMIAVLCGGVGAARFLRGLVREVDPSSVCAVVNTGDDTLMHGLHISPDLDTVTYTVAGAIDPDRQWGLKDETWNTLDSLRRYEKERPNSSQAASTWFGLGDRDMATHLYRTARLAEGATLSEVTAEIAHAWEVPIRIVPMSDDRVETVVDVIDADGVRRVSFQEYFVKRRHDVPVHAVDFLGSQNAVPTCRDLLHESEVVIVAPSNPIVSIGPIRSLSGIDSILSTRRDSVVAISPIVAGTAIKGPADRMMEDLGLEPSVVGVARHYAEICGTLVIDQQDAHLRAEVEQAGLRCVVTNTLMNDPDIARHLARTTLESVR